MAFRDELFPTQISYGCKSSPRYETTIVARKSGHETRNADWSRSRRGFDVANRVRIQAEYDEVLDFFLSVGEGQTYSFRFLDWLDYQVVLSRGLMGGGLGDGGPVYQLVKRYLRGAYTKDRDITKLVAGTIVGYRNAAAITVGSGAGQIAIGLTTGQITFVADATQSITGHTPGASHVFTTASDLAGLGIAGKVYLTGVSGSADSALNSIAHTIANKTGSGPYTWTVSTATTGLSASGGTAAKYPQASDELRWTGQFHNVVRFNIPEFPAVLNQGNIIDIQSIPLIEVRDE